MKQVNVKKLILPNIPYVFIALLATKVSEAVRLAPGSDASAKLLNIMTGLNTAFHSLVPSFHPIDLCVGVAAAIAIRLAVYIKGKNAKKFRKNLEYGSARWGTAEDIKPYVDPAFENNIILTQTERLTMNSRPKDPKTARNKNVLIVGGSGSGKTRFWLKPNLLQCTSKTYPTSFVVTDPKGDIVVSCGHALQKNGYQIKILNSLNFKKSMHYNPFAYIHSEKDILKLVTTLIANTKGEGKAGDDFWVKAETLLYTALIGYIHYEAPVEEQNFSTLIEFINAMEVREDDEDFKNPVDLMFDELKKRKPDHFAVRQYAKFKLSAGKTAKSILISCGARLAPFDIQELRELTAYDELQLDTLGDRKTALFIIMSDTDDTFNFLISMCYTQLFNLLCEKADDVYGGRLPVHVRCLIDEAANIGQIPRLEKLVATIRSREISCCLVLQAQSQLKALYKDSADTIIGNMDCSIFLGGKEPGTLKELAAALGKETIDSYNTGESRGREVSHSLNYQKLGKDLTVSVKNIMNEAYCRDISIKTRSSLDVKRRNGDFVGAFPVYGYMKAEDNKNLLVPDPYAARVVCDIFRMRLEGASASKIASELNRLGILSPLAYKKNNGLPYAKNGYADKADCKWSATTIIRILQDETYTGTLVQGKQGTPHYKIKQMEQRPASEWVRVPDAHEALIAHQDFELVQRIKGLDTRTSPNEDTVYLFSGILICGCCGSRMTRKTNRANGKEYHYYYCPTGKKKGCAHPVMLKESSLIDCVRDSLKAYIGNIASLEALLTGIDQTSINQALAKEYSDHITDNERRLEQVLEFKARLYESLVGGMLTKEEYASYKAKYTKQAEDIRESVRVLKEKLTEVLENRSERNRWISQFTQFSTLETLDRRALIHMVQSIRVRGKKELDITFTHEDEYKKALQLLALAAQQKDYEQRKVG